MHSILDNKGENSEKELYADVKILFVLERIIIAAKALVTPYFVFMFTSMCWAIRFLTL